MNRNGNSDGSVLIFLDLPWSDILIENIMPYLLPMDWLSLRTVSRKAYKLVSNYLWNLKYLDLSMCPSFPSTLWEEILNCKSLKVLILSNSQWCDIDSVKEIFQKNHDLRELDLTSCTNLRNGTLQPLVVNCKKLERFTLKNCAWLTNGAVEILAFHYCAKIKLANFSGCSQLSEASIILFISRQPKLLSISIGGLMNITDNTLECLSQNCPELKHLDISRCTRITDRGVKIFPCPAIVESGRLS